MRKAVNPLQATRVAPAADHVDFYDRVDLIPFAKLETFFKNACAN